MRLTQISFVAHHARHSVTNVSQFSGYMSPASRENGRFVTGSLVIQLEIKGYQHLIVRACKEYSLCNSILCCHAVRCLKCTCPRMHPNFANNALKASRCQHRLEGISILCRNLQQCHSSRVIVTSNVKSRSTAKCSHLIFKQIYILDLKPCF